MKNIAIALAAVAGFAAAELASAQNVVAPETATNITPVFESTQRTECQAVPSGGGWIGQALGGILGAGVGSQVGKGTGNSAAAAAGAVLGAQAGAAVTRDGQGPGQRCQIVIDKRLTGYTLATDRNRAVFVPVSLIDNYRP